jgi:hypothetical protein
LTLRFKKEHALRSAVEAYRFFYPTVSAEGLFNGQREAGIDDGEALALVAAGPRHVAFSANSDTPYLFGVLDLERSGPMVIDLPPGPYLGLLDDHHQRWITDLGWLGPDQGQGARYLLLPPGWTQLPPDGFHAAWASSRRVLLGLRALPERPGGIAAAKEALRRVAVHPLSDPRRTLPIVDLSERRLDLTPLRWEDNLEYWRRLHSVLQSETVLAEFRPMYGELAELGIEKGRAFAPGPALAQLLVQAACTALEEMRAEAFSSDRPERLVWSDRRWEWVGLLDDPNFETPNYLDLEARDRWFYQAMMASPAVLGRNAASGAIGFLAARDAADAVLEGGLRYRLRVAEPVPADLFWSVTVYDARTRSQVQAPSDRAVLGSLHGELEPGAEGAIELSFGPKPREGGVARWLETVPGREFFLYFRIYGPQAAALDGSWKLSDLEPLSRAMPPEVPAEVRSAISTPDRLETELGALELNGGMPTAETAALLYDRLDLQQGVSAFLNAFSGVSMLSLRKALLEQGVPDHDVLIFSRLVDSRSLLLTASCDTIYFLSFLDLGQGPVLVQVPERVFGVFDDFWSGWIADFGTPGPDRGAGGKYLLVPPGYSGPLPEGELAIARAPTLRVAMIGRAFLEDDDPGPAAARVREQLKIQRYVPGSYGSSVGAFLEGHGAFAALPPLATPRFVEGSGRAMCAVPPNDGRFFELLDEVVQLDPASALDPEIAGQFSSVGIAKGEHAPPDARIKTIQAEAARIGSATARTIALRPRPEEGLRYYEPPSSWINLPGTHARAMNSRTALHYLAFGVTPATSARLAGIGAEYLASTFDAEGQPFDGARYYRLVLPPGIPVAQFWSATLYDYQTRSMLETEQLYPRAGSQNYPGPAAIAGEGGAITLHMGPERPEGIARGNWIQTVPGRGWWIILRFYSPLEAFFDKRWRPGEIESG